MTTPGGVPNLPQGALTLDNIASNLEDMSGAAMKSRAVARFPSIMDLSTGLSPVSDLTPFGILTRIWAEVNSLVANSDPADIQGPDDLPPLLLEFIEGLPVVGQFIDLFQAILGDYEGEDETLLGIQTIFAPIRALVGLVPALFGGLSIDDLSELSPEQVWETVITTIFNPLGLIQDDGIRDFVKGLVDNIVSIIRRVPFVGPTLADSLDALIPDMDSWFTDTEATRTNITNGITGAGLENPTQTELTTAVQGQADAVAGTAAAVAQVQAALSPGNPDSDDFEYSASGNWGANWSVMEDGVGGDPSVDGHNAVWTADYTQDSEIVARRLLKVATSDNQTVSCILGSAPGNMTDGTSAHDLWLRCTTFSTYATRTGLRMRFWANKSLELAWFNAGTKTVLATGTAGPSMSNGSTLTFEAGQGLTPRRFIAKINNSPVLDFTEAGTTSQIGASYRSRGVGLRGEFSLIGIGFIPALMMQPGKLKQWTATG